MNKNNVNRLVKFKKLFAYLDAVRFNEKHFILTYYNNDSVTIQIGSSFMSGLYVRIETIGTTVRFSCCENNYNTLFSTDMLLTPEEFQELYEEKFFPYSTIYDCTKLLNAMNLIKDLPQFINSIKEIILL